MTFQEQLNQYLQQLDCTAKELSAASGVSASVISRYRNGSQRPEPEGVQWQKLAAGMPPPLPRAWDTSWRGSARETERGQLLKRASPLMEIYAQDRKTAFERFLQADGAHRGARRALLSALPIYALSDGLAKRILDRNEIPGPEQTAIMQAVHAQRQRVQRILEHSPVSDVLPDISQEEYQRYPMALTLAGAFYPRDVLLSYPEYREYLTLCDEFAAAHPGYSCTRDRNLPFRNIQITILENERVTVTKNKAPAIHFVIHHPKMCAAIENMVIPIIEPQPE